MTRRALRGMAIALARTIVEWTAAERAVVHPRRPGIGVSRGDLRGSGLLRTQHSAMMILQIGRTTHTCARPTTGVRKQRGPTGGNAARNCADAARGRRRERGSRAHPVSPYRETGSPLAAWAGRWPCNRSTACWHRQQIVRVISFFASASAVACIGHPEYFPPSASSGSEAALQPWEGTG